MFVFSGKPKRVLYVQGKCYNPAICELDSFVFNILVAGIVFVSVDLYIYDSDSDSDIYLFDHIITNILHNYQFCSEYKRVMGQGDLH